MAGENQLILSNYKSSASTPDYIFETYLQENYLTTSANWSFTRDTAELQTSSAELVANFNPWGISGQAILNVNKPPIWNNLPATITFTYGTPSEVLLSTYVSDPESDPFVLSKNAVSLPAGVTFDAANKKLVYNGFGNLNGESTTGHIFYADDTTGQGAGTQTLSTVANITFLHQAPLQLTKLLNPGTVSVSWGTQLANLYSGTSGGTLEALTGTLAFTKTTALTVDRTMATSVSVSFTGGTANVTSVVNLAARSSWRFLPTRAYESGGTDADDTPTDQVGIGSLGNQKLSKGPGLSKGSM